MLKNQKLSIIVAVANNNVIGGNNQLLWHLPKDLAWFKQKTMGHHIITGRKNYESIGKPLPGRSTIIITRQKDYTALGCTIADSIHKALQYAKHDDEPFIIGGGQIYRQTMHLATKLYITRVFADFNGDTFFPDIDLSIWQLESEEKHEPDEKNKYPFSFEIYTRK